MTLSNALSRGFLLLFCAAWFSGIAGAQEPDPDFEAVNAYLKRFAEHPAEAMSEAPPRWDQAGRRVEAGTDSRFSEAATRSGADIEARDRVREKMCMTVRGRKRCLGFQPGNDTRAQIRGSDRPEDLVDQLPLVRSLEKMEAMNLRRAELRVEPWSDDYWPIYKGVLGARYASPEFPANRGGVPGRTWRVNHAYVQKHPAWAIVRGGDEDEIDRLSPSEKYGALVGDPDFALTSYLWNLGEEEYLAKGGVDTWLGICDGWSAAATMMPRPEEMLTLPAAGTGKPIRFYPSDIKALASLLWSSGRKSIRFIGGRCGVKHPRADENGRVIDPDCFDTNPGTWHLAVVNQLGIAKRGFVLDASADDEIWNQPALKYHYWYFNPQDLDATGELSEARVPKASFKRDKFRRYRSPGFAAAVGVVMDFSYMVETAPDHSRRDSPHDDAYRTVRYVYDLELDRDGNIIGGEWYTGKHPDFLWVPEPGSRSRSISEDQAVGPWVSPDSPLPESWRKAAIQASLAGQPLGKLVERMVEWANTDSSSCSAGHLAGLRDH